jgi:hypothetical protein
MIPYSITFNNEHTIYETAVKCVVNEDEFNLTYNPSLLQDKTNLESELLSFATGSEFSPYSTGVGLYDNDGNLLAIGKFAKPVPMTKKSDMNIILKFDSAHQSVNNFVDLSFNGRTNKPDPTKSRNPYRGSDKPDNERRREIIRRASEDCIKKAVEVVSTLVNPVKVSNSSVSC